jgi:hypothetical protein
MTTPRLTARALGRATLARQHLLRRTDAGPADAVRHLVGLQTQVPPNHYTALWTRLAGFDPAEFSRRFAQREFVRLSLMRCTLHTVTAEDAVRLRPLFEVPHERQLRSHFRTGLAGAAPEAVAARARELLETRPPMEARELGAELGEAWPEAEPRALAMAARQLLPLVQVPPRGLWRRGGAARLTTAEHWLGDAVARTPAASLHDLIRRYLAAFGPASVKDAQKWSGLTRLRPVLDALHDELVVFRDDATDAELFDLPDAPRPDADTPAPARFLPEFDNVFIGHDDRSRVIPDPERHALAWNGNVARPVFLSDGVLKGTWSLEREGDRATLEVRPFARLSASERAALEEEGEALLGFHTPDAAHALRWSPWP